MAEESEKSAWTGDKNASGNLTKAVRHLNADSGQYGLSGRGKVSGDKPASIGNNRKPVNTAGN